MCYYSGAPRVPACGILVPLCCLAARPCLAGCASLSSRSFGFLGSRPLPPLGSRSRPACALPRLLPSSASALRAGLPRPGPAALARPCPPGSLRGCRLARFAFSRPRVPGLPSGRFVRCVRSRRRVPGSPAVLAGLCRPASPAPLRSRARVPAAVAPPPSSPRAGSESPLLLPRRFCAARGQDLWALLAGPRSSRRRLASCGGSPRAAGRLPRRPWSRMVPCSGERGAIHARVRFGARDARVRFCSAVMLAFLKEDPVVGSEWDDRQFEPALEVLRDNGLTAPKFLANLSVSDLRLPGELPALTRGLLARSLGRFNSSDQPSLRVHVDVGEELKATRLADLDPELWPRSRPSLGGGRTHGRRATGLRQGDRLALACVPGWLSCVGCRAPVSLVTARYGRLSRWAVGSRVCPRRLSWVGCRAPVSLDTAWPGEALPVGRGVPRD